MQNNQDQNQNFQGELEIKLSLLTDSKDSIVSVSNFILKKLLSSNKGIELATTVSNIWTKMLLESEKPPLPLIYVCNELLVNFVKIPSRPIS